MDSYVQAIVSSAGGNYSYSSPEAFRRDLNNLPAVNQLRFAIDQSIAVSYLFWLYGSGFDEFLKSYAEWLKDFVNTHLANYESEFDSYAAGNMYTACKNIVSCWYSFDWIDVPINDLITFVYRSVTVKDIKAPLALLPEMAAPYLAFRNSLPKSIDIPGPVCIPGYRIYGRRIHIHTAVNLGTGFNRDLPFEVTNRKCYQTLLASAAQLNAPILLLMARCNLSGIKNFESILGWFDLLCHCADKTAVTNGNTRLFYATHCVLRNTFDVDFINVARSGEIRSIGRANSEGVGCAYLNLLAFTYKFFGTRFKSKDLFIRLFGKMPLDGETQLAVEFIATYGTDECKAEAKAAAESLDLSCEAINLISQTTTTSLAQVRGADEIVEDTTDDQEENLDLSDLPDIDDAEPGLEAEEEDDTVADGDEPGEDDSSSKKEDQTGDEGGQQPPDDPGADDQGTEPPGGDSGSAPTQTSDMQGAGKPEDIDASDDDGLVFEVSPEGSETVDSVIIREEIDKFLTDILVNPPKKLSPQTVSALTTLQKNWVHILSVKTIVGILERLVDVPEKFKQLKSNKE